MLEGEEVYSNDFDGADNLLAGKEYAFKIWQ